jgi:hypothetical protein
MDIVEERKNSFRIKQSRCHVICTAQVDRRGMSFGMNFYNDESIFFMQVLILNLYSSITCDIKKCFGRNHFLSNAFPPILNVVIFLQTIVAW